MRRSGLFQLLRDDCGEVCPVRSNALFVASTALLLSAAMFGQEVSLGPVPPRPYLGPHGKAVGRNADTVERPRSLELSLPPPPVFSLSELTETEWRKKITPGSNATGITRDVPAESLKQGTCTVLPDGTSVWRIRFRSPQASLLRVHFENFDIADSVMWLVGDASNNQEIFGPYTGRGIFSDGEFWSHMPTGDTVTLVYESAAACTASALPFMVTEIAHIWGNGLKPDSKVSGERTVPASCESPFSCRSTDSTKWQSSADSVAMISAINNGQVGPGFCTGTLITTRTGQGQPYFLSANHCLAGTGTVPFNASAIARTFVFQWFFQQTACSPFSTNQGQQTIGSRYVTSKGADQGDYLLLVLEQQPPAGAWFSGWAPGSPPVMGSSVVGIHHPLGYEKTISFGTRGFDASVSVDGLGVLPAAKYLRVGWTLGTTEQGSSGSPLFLDSSPGIVVGTLTAGPLDPVLACTFGGMANRSSYGRFSEAYLELRTWLEDCSYSVTTGTTSFSSQGGGSTIAVSTSTSCAWSAFSNTSWITITAGSSGTGTGNISFIVQPNTSFSSRSGTITVGGQTVTISQSGVSGCTLSLVPSAFSALAPGSTGSFNVLSDVACSYTATPNASWITVTGFTGSFTNFRVDQNFGSSSRIGTITINSTTAIAPVVFTIIQNGTGTGTQTSGLRFVPLTPCRLMETRGEYNFEGRTGTFGPPYLRAGETRTLTLANSNVCQIPAAAKAYVLNVTLIPRGGVDFATLWPGGEARPNFWSIRSPDGQIVANQAIVKSGNGSIQLYVSHDADFLIDISGYFGDAPAGGTNLVYYPLTPCRVIETRQEYRSSPGPFGPPTMAKGEKRTFRFPNTPYCTVPPGATAYSATLTVVPPAPLPFMTLWPAGGSQPNVSSINSFAGRILANNVIVPASQDGSIDVYAFDRTDFIVDINGYFAPDNGQGLYYFPVTQCRANDSTVSGGMYQDNTTRTINVPTAGNCAGITANAKGYVVNVTAIPNGNPMPFITVYPTGQPQPNASVLNAFQGQTVTNSTIVPAGTNGAIDVYAYRQTHVVVEISGYFGR